MTDGVIESVVGISLLAAFTVFLRFLSKSNKRSEDVIDRNTVAFEKMTGVLGAFTEVSHSCKNARDELDDVIKEMKGKAD